MTARRQTRGYELEAELVEAERGRMRAASAPAMLDTSGGVTTDTGGPMCPDSSIPVLKRCCVCGEDKAAADFYASSGRTCKVCHCNRSAERRSAHGQEYVQRTRREYYQRTKEERAKKNKEWKEAHPDECREYSRRWNERHPEKRKAATSAYIQNHPDRIRARDKAKYAARREELLAANREWCRAHPEHRNASQARRRAAKLGACGSHTADDVIAQRMRQRGRCFWCGCSLPKGYHVDHVVPLSRGGSDGPENLVISCPSCNLSKGGKHPMDFSGVLL